MKRAGAAAALIALLGAGAWSFRLAWAERLALSGDPARVARAAALVPCNAPYRAALGDLAGAVARNPRDSGAWIERGLGFEAGGELARAEACLLEAARVNRQWDPRWALMNFHLRRNDPGRFWLWAERAAAMSWPARTAFYRLCRHMARDPNEIAEKIAGPHPELAADCLRFTLGERELAAAPRLAGMVIEREERDQLPLLLQTCDDLIHPDFAAAALQLWNKLSESGWIPHDTGLLSNGDFRAAILSRGFDWRAGDTAGARVEARPGLLQVDLSGSQPERCEILSHFAVLEPGHAYRLAWRPPLPAGFRWRVYDPSKPPAPPRDLTETASDFIATRLVRIALVYERPSGTTRYRGVLSLANVRLDPLPA